MRTILILITACLISISANCQTQIGPVAGVNLASFRYSKAVSNNSFRVGYSLGIKTNTNFGEIMSFQPALIWNNIGGKSKDGDNSLTTSVNYLALPLNLAVRLGDEEGGQFQIFLGPYLGYAISGTRTNKTGSEEDSDDISFGTEMGRINPFDFGFNAGVGYKTGAALFNLNYGLGLNNLSNFSGSGSSKIYNSVISLNVAFLFGKSGSE
jgi:hypothetical protein